MGNLFDTAEVIPRVIASEKNWIEGKSIQQLETTAKLKGIKMAVGLPETLFDHSLGTIGGGNHFAELQQIEEIFDPDAINALGVDSKRLHLLVHSGSRGLGESVLRHHVEAFGHSALEDDTPAARHYISRHDQSVKWAHANRELIAHRFMTALRSNGRRILDLAHNTVTSREIDGEHYWLHRKGASPSDCDALVIPGSRGTISYLVQPIGEQLDNAFSLAHGAGRKWARSDVKGRLSHKYKVGDLRKTKLGNVVICENKALIYEEAPQAYKNIDVVIQDLVDAGLIRILATLRPVITYKTRRIK